MKLWVDDIRPAPEGWTHSTTFIDAVLHLMLFWDDIDVISLDHDLGGEKTGYDLAKFMVDQNYWPSEIWLHTSNPVGRFNMYQLLEHYAPKGVTVHP